MGEGERKKKDIKLYKVLLLKFWIHETKTYKGFLSLGTSDFLVNRRMSLKDFWSFNFALLLIFPLFVYKQRLVAVIKGFHNKL